jgi:hypothetical protein
MINVGILYQYGRGATKNIPTAIEWYTEAVNQGNKYAPYRLGEVCLKEYEVRDLKQAVNWYQKAANSGYDDAINKAKILNEKGFYAKEDEPESMMITNKNIKRFTRRKNKRQNHSGQTC